jgi:hypothetical protein
MRKASAAGRARDMRAASQNARACCPPAAAHTCHKQRHAVSSPVARWSQASGASGSLAQHFRLAAYAAVPAAPRGRTTQSSRWHARRPRQARLGQSPGAPPRLRRSACAAPWRLTRPRAASPRSAPVGATAPPPAARARGTQSAGNASRRRRQMGERGAAASAVSAMGEAPPSCSLQNSRARPTCGGSVSARTRVSAHQERKSGTLGCSQPLGATRHAV